MLQFKIQRPLLASACASLAVLTGLTLPHTASFAQMSEAGTQRGWTLDLKKGEVLQVVVPEERAEGSEARQSYYQNAFPIAERLGYANEGLLRVREKVRGEYDPSVFVFFSWPSAEAAKGYRSNPRFAEFKALRREAWHEMNIYDAQIREDIQITFDPAKHYTALIAWLDPETRADYTRYLEGIEPAVKRAGGRFIYKMYDPYMQALSGSPDGPGQITFVEWETTDGFAKVQQSPEYREHQQYFGSSVQKFEFYWLQAPA